ncbi:lytic transglycosylase domain-containing protein [Lishizhenia sp.]|uniref:lytic transglycosylase domain-containing protein n=1 Tax=Lishizhenia sp. TaxID=2497594 RepID=UPI00299D0536|nr:lytic transglycosylase domain-containing protein [Lishizhenia sp.]MDX1445366.1 lytic transglycosylase domain-containing protein [Lishizhenia sp.]
MAKFIIFILLGTLLWACNNSPTIQKEETIVHNNVESSFSDFIIPDYIEFLDTKVLLKDIDIRERYEREIITNAYYHSSTFFILKRSKRWFPVIEKILKEEGLPDDFKYLAVAESGLTQARSYVGALGFWQFMEGTAKDYGLIINKDIDERKHVVKSTRAACAYLKDAKEKLGSWILAAAAYNRGVNGISKNLEGQYADNFFDLNLNTETSRYVFRIMALKEIIEHPSNYNFKINTYYSPYKTIQKIVDSSLSDLSLWAKNEGFNKKILKKLNPWLISNQLRIEPGKSYVILLPAKGANLNAYREDNGE